MRRVRSRRTPVGALFGVLRLALVCVLLLGPFSMRGLRRVRAAEACRVFCGRRGGAPTAFVRSALRDSAARAGPRSPVRTDAAAASVRRTAALRPSLWHRLLPSVSATAAFSSFSVSEDAYLRDVIDEELLQSGYRRPPVQWYPGHIAKAERQLSETLRAVDVVVEVRDARACKATSHPRVGEWCAGHPRIVVLTHVDTIPKSAEIAWKRAYDQLGAHRWDDSPIDPQVSNQARQAKKFRTKFVASPSETLARSSSSSRKRKDANNEISPVEQVLFVDAKQGQGIHALHRAIFKAGQHVNERRARRGLNARPLRVGVIGYPNVGKSALINRIIGRRRARTANTPGVTRSLQWIRVRTDDTGRASGSSKHATSTKKDFELLDSPGIIPAKMVDQSDAVLLAACNCIGDAAYDNQAVAAYLCEWLKTIYIMERQGQTAPAWRDKVKERYAFDPLEKIEDYATGNLRYMSGEDMLFRVADGTCKGNPEDAARKILQDFRKGRMGPICLQLAPQSEADKGQVAVPISPMDGRGNDDPTKTVTLGEYRKMRMEQAQQEQQERARAAVETAKEIGLELPPVVEEGKKDAVREEDVGKGMFDGW